MRLSRTARVVACQRRRGMSLLMTMVTISTSLVLTMTFVRTQTVQRQLSRNSARHGLALQAAQSGAAIAARLMSSPEWDGIGSKLEGITFEDTAQQAGYHVTFEPLTSASTAASFSTSNVQAGAVSGSATDSAKLAYDQSLYVKIRSEGLWRSKSDDKHSQSVSRTVEVVMHLMPRSNSSTDIAPNPDDFDSIQHYAVFASDGSDSVTLDPGARVVGDVWASDVEVFSDPPWSDETQDELLTSIGLEYVSESGDFRHPHPLSGRVYHFDSMEDRMAVALKNLRVPTSQVTRTPIKPAVDFNAWKSYQVYEGGPTYHAKSISRHLHDTYLHPTADNPLGIFYIDGSIEIAANVTIIGTLVSTGRVDILGNEVRLMSYNWRGTNGESKSPESSHWPRLPVIVADKIETLRDVRATIEGAVVLRQEFIGGGGLLEYADAKDIDAEVKVTARPLQQPYSEIAVQSDFDLSQLIGSGHYAVWIDSSAHEASGSWYPISSVDLGNRKLTAVGEVNTPDGALGRIKASRTRYIDIRGPLIGRRHNVHRCTEWDLSSDVWDKLHGYWREFTKYELLLAEQNRVTSTGPDVVAAAPQTTSFVAWLADPASFSGWSEPYREVGLSLEPTFQVARPQGIRYRWSPPLFKAPAANNSTVFYSSPDAASTTTPNKGGYRWNVVSWGAVPSS